MNKIKVYYGAGLFNEMELAYNKQLVRRIRENEYLRDKIEIYVPQENEAINETVDAFIKGGLNLSHASASSYVHRNTLIYRIEKVNRVIGLDLRNFEDCLIFVNMREIYKMVVKKQ